jgi:hypothetical protein
MAQPPSKKLKSSDERGFELMSLGRESFVSKSGIANLLKTIKQEGLPQTFDRSAQFRARKQVCHTSTPYGKLVGTMPLVLADGQEGEIAFQNPLACLYYNCQKSPHYAEIVREALERHPCGPATPWTLVLYQDGVDPSDGLSNNHSRKSTVWYWSFQEFGLRHLACEEVWGTLCVMRSTAVNKLDGAITRLFCHLLSLFFGPVHDIRLTGVAVSVDGSLRGEQPLHSHIFAEVGVLIADLPALKEMVGCKGHGGHKPCFLCRNATNHAIPGRPLHLVCPDAVPITDFDFDKFIKYTDDDIKETLRRLDSHHDAFVAGAMTKVEFQARESVLGWTWVRDNPLLTEKFRLRLASSAMFDWAHVYVNDGLADDELGMCMKVLHSNRTASTYRELGEYVARFTVPKSSPSVTRLFSQPAAKANLRKSGFTCSGSEFLTLAPMVLRYFERVVAARGKFMKHVASLIAVLQVVVMLIALKTGTVAADALTIAIKNHLVLFKEAYGDSAVRPKHHFAAHLGPMLARFPFLLSTFVHERKHRVPKKYTRDRRNLQSWDLGAIEEVTCHQLWELGKPLLQRLATYKPKGKMLDVLREAFPGVSDAAFMLANSIKVDGGAANAGDVVSCIVGGSRGIGELLMSVVVTEGGSETAYSIVSLWDLAEEHPAWPTLAVSESRVVKLLMDCLDKVHTYSMSLDRKTCVVHDPYGKLV